MRIILLTLLTLITGFTIYLSLPSPAQAATQTFSATDTVELSIGQTLSAQTFWERLLSLFSKQQTVVTKATLISPDGRETPLILPSNQEALTIPQELMAKFPAGIYKVRVETQSGGKTLLFEQDFAWGVLAINTNKSIYLPNETAKLSFAVLNEAGRMVCDAKLTLTITAPSPAFWPFKNTTQLSTENGTIKVNPDCTLKDYTEIPDYEAVYTVGGPGSYHMTLTAQTANGEFTLSDSFDVRADVPFDVERKIFPTRIYPPKPYPVQFTIAFNQDFQGQIVETVPAEFEISPNKEIGNWKLEIGNFRDGMKDIVWEVKAAKGEIITLGYSFDAPDISPEFYLLGPLRLRSRSGPEPSGPKAGQALQLRSTTGCTGTTGTTGNESPRDTRDTCDTRDTLIFAEQRQWQIAADAVTKWVTHRTTETVDSVPAITDNANMAETAQEGATQIDTRAAFGTTTGYFLFKPGQTNSTTGTPGTTPQGFGFWTTNPYIGPSASADWTFKVQVDDNRSPAVCRLRVIAYTNTSRSTTGATQLFDTSDLATDLCTNGTTSPSQTFNPGALNLTTTAPSGTAKYILFEFWVNVTTAGVAASRIDLYIDGTSDTSVSPEATNTFVTAANITGTIYSDEGTTAITSQPAMQVRKDGTQCTSCTGNANASGVYTIAIETPASGNTVTAFIDNATPDGSLLTRYSAANTAADGKNMTGQNIYQDRVIARGSAAGSVANADFADYDNDNDVDLLFTANAGALTVDTGKELHVWTASTFAPGGNVTAPNLHVAGTYSAGSETLILNGSGTGACTAAPGTIRPLCIDGGTFTASTNTTRFTGTSASNIEAITYNTLQLQPSGAGSPTYTPLTGTLTTNAGLTIGDGTNAVTVNFDTNDPTLDVLGDLTISANGTLTASQTGSFSVAGSWSNSGTFTAGTGTVTFDATATGRTLGGTMTGSSGFYNIDFNGSGGGWTFNASADVTNNFNLTLGTLTAPSGSLTISQNFTKTGGTFTHNSGTVVFNDATKTSTITSNANITFNSISSTTAGKTLQFDAASGGSPVISIAGTFTITGVSGNQIHIHSDSAGTQWLANFSSAQSITYAHLHDAGCDVASANVTLDDGSTDAGNNGTCWVFPIEPISIQGGVELQGGVTIGD